MMFAPGLALNIQNDGGMFIGPGGLPDIFCAIEDGSDIAEPNRRAVAVRNDDRAIAFAREQLIVRADGIGLMRTVEGAFGLIDVGLAQRSAQILKTQAVGGNGCVGFA